MGNFVNRATLEDVRSVNDVDYIDPPWLFVAPGSGNETIIDTVPARYRKISGDTLSEMDAGEKAMVDTNALNDSRDRLADELDQVENILRAFMLVVIDGFNQLRAQHSLAPYTTAQLKAAIRNKMGS